MTIHVLHTAADGSVLARETQRFAIRGRVYSDALPADAPEYGGALEAKQEDGSAAATVQATPRRLLRRVTVTAPDDMTAFARTSGDFNPIHTSTRGARISGLAAPLVHGMWLSATAQHVVQALDDKGAHYESQAGPTTCTAWCSLTTRWRSPSSASARSSTAAWHSK